MRTVTIPTLVLLSLTLGGVVNSVEASSSLMGMLTSQVGITEQQANSGITAIMDIAKQHLSGTDYAKLLSGAPDLGAIVSPPTKPAQAAAQTPATGTDWLGHIGTLMGTPQLAQMAQLTQFLSGLGFTPDMIGKFLKITLDYVQGSGGANLVGMLAGALGLTHNTTK